MQPAEEEQLHGRRLRLGQTSQQVGAENRLGRQPAFNEAVGGAAVDEEHVGVAGAEPQTELRHAEDPGRLALDGQVDVAVVA